MKNKTEKHELEREGASRRDFFKAGVAGGNIAGTARKQIEVETGRRVVSTQNFLGRDKREANPQKLTKKD